jgi:hypothetical protein
MTHEEKLKMVLGGLRIVVERVICAAEGDKVA